MSEQSPFPFQERVAAHLLAGRNVLLQAPTGAGKTRAALLPWLHGIHKGEPAAFPIRCIYSVPMRVLANQFEDAYQETMSRFQLRHGKAWLRTAIQTGEHPDDPRFEDSLIFATLDQTLSSVLGIPYSLGQGSSNLNAGAVMSSYLVWDEFHLFGREQALPTTLHLLDMLRGITPFCLMTATFSQTLLAGLAEWLGAEVVTVPPAERASIPSQRNKERVFQVSDEPLTASAVLDSFERRTIAICNTVERAQQLCRHLRADAPPGTEIRLLHSRFYQKDREATTAWVQLNFGEGWREASSVERAILVATQVVEVGMDITCERLHSELAPANALVQRAGRCARFAGEHGVVQIHALPLDEKGKPQTAPYDLTKDGDLCVRTWTALKAHDRKALDYEAELTLLEEVHHEDDAALLRELRERSYDHRQDMMETMADHDFRHARALIRDIDNRQLLLHPAPGEDAALQRSPWALEALSIPRGTFFRLAKGRASQQSDDPRPWLEYEQEALDWALQYPLLVEGGAEDERRPGPARFEWKRVDNQSELTGRTLFAIHPSLVSYDPEYGLMLEPGGSPHHSAPERKRKGRTEKDFVYCLERYEEHIAGLWEAYLGGFYDSVGQVQRPSLRDEVAYALPRLAARLNTTPETLTRLLKLMFAGHDVGKLGTGWQAWVRRWQSEKVRRPYDPTHCYAHTDYDGSAAQKALQKKMGKRPPHAAESAAALVDVIVAVTEENVALSLATISALARHHAATHRGNLGDYWRAYNPAAQSALVAALEVVGLEPTVAAGVRWEGYEGVSDYLVRADPNEPEPVLTYLWLSRLLRLADQRSQQ